MKKFLALILAALMLTCMLAGCAQEAQVDDSAISDNGTNAESDADYILANGKMIIGMTLFAPMNYYDDANKLIGFETILLVCSSKLDISQFDLHLSGLEIRGWDKAYIHKVTGCFCEGRIFT